jgi:hypothetical protein
MLHWNQGEYTKSETGKDIPIQGYEPSPEYEGSVLGSRAIFILPSWELKQCMH